MDETRGPLAHRSEDCGVVLIVSPSPDYEPPAIACSELEVPRQAPQPGSSSRTSGRPISSRFPGIRLPPELRRTWTSSKEAQPESEAYMLAAGPCPSHPRPPRGGLPIPLFDDKAGLQREQKARGYKGAHFHCPKLMGGPCRPPYRCVCGGAAAVVWSRACFGLLCVDFVSRVPARVRKKVVVRKAWIVYVSCFLFPFDSSLRYQKASSLPA